MVRKKVAIFGAAAIMVVMLNILKDAGPLVVHLQHYQDCDIFFMEFFPPPSNLDSFPQSMVKGNVLTPRFECNVEAAVKHHPNNTVCLLLNTEDSDLLGKLERDLQPMLATYNQSKLLVMPLSLDHLFKGTPLLRWWQEELQYTLSKWKTNHLSDAARLTFLWKYGGLYLDHDVLVLKSTDDLGNAIGLSSFRSLGTSALKFSRPGHPFLTKWLYSIPGEYSEDERSSIGPDLGTKLVVPFCQGDVPPGREDLRQLSGKFCDFNLQILSPPHSFYPIPWEDWELVFEAENQNHPKPNLTIPYAVHLWHDLNRNKYKTVGDIPKDALYRVLCQDHCPITYQNKF